MKHGILPILLAVSVLGLTAQDLTGPLKPVYRSRQVDLEDEQGQVLLWIDGWARVHSPEVMLWQEGYNRRLQQSFGNLVMGGMRAPYGIAIVAPQPPGRRGIQETGVFAVPARLKENGVLTRDTLGIPFFEAGIQWNSLAQSLSADCQKAKLPEFPVQCRLGAIGWRTPASSYRPEPGDDPLLLGARRVELENGLAALRRLQAAIDAVVTVTAENRRATAIDDQALRELREVQCVGWPTGVLRACSLDADDLRFPYDWLTAQVAPGDLARVLPAIRAAEHEVQMSLALSTDLQELSRRALSGR